MHFLTTLVHQDSTEGYKFNYFSIKFSSSSRKHIETLKEDIKLAVMRKPGFENREDSILKITSTFLTKRSQLQGTERKLLPLIPHKNGNPLIATLVEDMKPAVAVKDDFAYRDKSKVIAYFGIFGLSRF